MKPCQWEWYSGTNDAPIYRCKRCKRKVKITRVRTLPLGNCPKVMS
jgi:hypothetical protein